MAEGRMLKKNVSTSRKLAELKSDSARLLWTWILPHLDVAGRFSGEASVVKGSVVPRLKHMTEEKVDQLLEELHESGLIYLYAFDGERYLELRRFEDFQNLRTDRESESKIPEPRDSKEDEGESGSGPGVVPESSTALKDKDRDKDKDEDLSAHVAEDVRLVQLLVDLMLQNNPKSSIIKRLTPERRAEWIRQCRLIREADGKSVEDIELVIRFCQGDSFWQSNILSMPKLREKWDQLWMKAKRNQGESVGSRVGAHPPASARDKEITRRVQDFIKRLWEDARPEIEAARGKGLKALEEIRAKKEREIGVKFAEYERKLREGAQAGQGEVS